MFLWELELIQNDVYKSISSEENKSLKQERKKDEGGEEKKVGGDSRKPSRENGNSSNEKKGEGNNPQKDKKINKEGEEVLEKFKTYMKNGLDKKGREIGDKKNKKIINIKEHEFNDLWKSIEKNGKKLEKQSPKEKGTAYQIGKSSFRLREAKDTNSDSPAIELQGQGKKMKIHQLKE